MKYICKIPYRAKIVAVVGAYLIMGAMLYAHGRSAFCEYESNDQKIMVSENGLTQKLVGNDLAIKEIRFPVDASELSDNAEVNVNFSHMNDRTGTTEILQTDIFSGSQLHQDGVIRLHYPQYKMICDRDYYITFQVADKSQGVLYLMCSDNGYSGTYAEGRDCGVSCAYSVDMFTHDSYFLFLWKLILIYGLIAVSLVIWTRVSFWRSMEFGTLGIALFLFLLGMFDQIRYGETIIAIVCVVVGCITLGWALRYTDHFKEILTSQKNLKGDICLWLLFLVLFALHSRGLTVEGWDEFVQWAPTVKNMYVFDCMPIHAKSTLKMFRYPPLYSLFQYLFVKMYGAYNVGVMHLAKQFFEMTLLMGAWDLIKEKKKRWIFYACIGVAVIGLPELLFQSTGVGHAYVNTLYADIPVGVVFGVMLVECWRYLEEKSSVRQAVIVFLCAFVLILTKDNGMILLVSALAGYMFLFLLDKQKRKSYFVVLGCVTGGFVSGRLIWQRFVNYHISHMNDLGGAVQKIVDNATTEAVQTVSENAGREHVNVVKGSIKALMEVAGLSPGRILDYLTGKAPGYQYEIIPKHILKLLFDGGYKTTLISMSFVMWLVVIIAVLWFIGARKDRYQFVILSTLACVGIYHLVYTFTLKESEALRFASEERYLGSFLLGIAIWIVPLLAERVEAGDRQAKMTLLVSVLAILILTDACSSLRTKIIDKSYESDEQEADVGAAAVIRQRLREDDRLFYISGDDADGTYYVFRYLLTPIMLNPKTEYAVSDNIIGEQNLNDRIKEYDFVYLDVANDDFTEYWSVFFDNTDLIKSNTLYQVTDSESSYVRLVPVKNF